MIVSSSFCKEKFEQVRSYQKWSSTLVSMEIALNEYYCLWGYWSKNRNSKNTLDMRIKMPLMKIIYDKSIDEIWHNNYIQNRLSYLIFNEERHMFLLILLSSLWL